MHEKTNRKGKKLFEELKIAQFAKDEDFQYLEKLVDNVYKRREKGYKRWMFVMTAFVALLTGIMASPVILETIQKPFRFQPDLVIELSETTVAFDNSVLDKESVLYSIETEFQTPAYFANYDDLKCSFSYRNLGKKLLRNPTLRIYLIDPIDRVIAYDELGMSTREIKFKFQQESNIREIRGNVRILASIWSEKDELVGYCVSECRYQEINTSLAIIVAVLSFIIGLVTISLYRYLRQEL